jgi:hypothetical protein
MRFGDGEEDADHNMVDGVHGLIHHGHRTAGDSNGLRRDRATIQHPIHAGINAPEPADAPQPGMTS